MIRNLAFACLTAFALAVHPTAAFDNLERFAESLPATLDGSFLFNYAAPRGGFGSPGAARSIPVDTYLAQALAFAKGPEQVTAIDFSAFNAALVIGDPPATTTVLFGTTGFGQLAVDRFLERGFTERQVERFPVYAIGDDYSIDLGRSREGDPLAAGMGKAERIALGGDFLVRTAAWAEMEAALSGLDTASPSGDAWREILLTLEEASGSNPRLELASGWSVSAFFDTGPVPSLADAPGKSKSKPPAATAAVPPFALALFAVTETEDAVGLHIALPFFDAIVAQRTSEIISDRLIRHPFTPSTPRITVRSGGGYHVAVLSIDMSAGDLEAARELYSGWMSDIYQRKFHPLSIVP